MKHKKAIRTGAYTLIILFFAYLILIRAGVFEQKNPAMQNARVGGGALSVNGLVMKPEIVEEKIVVSGSVIPGEEVLITSEINGKVDRIFFEEGKHVSKGQLLIKINDSELQAQVRRLTAQRKLLEDREFRQRKLLERDAISREEYNTIETELLVNQAEIEFLKAQIEKTEIRAPFTGIIGLRSISEGAFLTPQSSIARLIEYKPLKIDFSIPERYASRVRRGTIVLFSVNNSKRQYEARVIAVEPQIDPNTRTLQVRAQYANENAEIIPGTYAEITLVLDNLENSLMVPTEAIIPDMGSSKVVVYRNGGAVHIPVVTGLRTNTHVQVIEGLNARDTVIVSGLLQIRPGIQIQFANLK